MPTSALPEPARSRTQAQRSRQLHALARYGQPLGVACAAVLALGFWLAGGSAWLGAWVAAQALVLVVEIGLARAYLRASETEREHPRWERRLALCCAVLGLLWGLLPWFMMPDRAALETVLVLAMVGITTATVNALGISTLCFAGYVAPQLLALTALYLARGTTESLTLAGLLLVYLAFLAGAQRTAASSFVGHVLTQLRNEELVARLQRADTELSKSLAEHQLLFDLASVGIAEIRNRTIVRANARLEQLLDYPSGALLGLPAQTLYPLGLTSEQIHEIIDPLARGEAVDRDTQVRPRDGSLLWVALACRALDPGEPDGGIIAVFNDITDRREREAAMQRLAHEDALTGLPNRRLLEDRLRVALLRTRRHGSSVALLLIDIDGFKKINDGYGHEAGDHVLATIAQRLLGCVRACDTVSRLGGDEFVVLLDNPAQPGDASQIATELVAIASQPIAFRNHTLQVGASVGISIAPRDSLDAATLMRCADEAMYRAKQSGRGVWRVYAGSTAASALRSR
jgi:diguanylate cyclase (GGDEF)-like protein/PAS domain S-box-containing protein